MVPALPAAAPRGRGRRRRAGHGPVRRSTAQRNASPWRVITLAAWGRVSAGRGGRAAVSPQPGLGGLRRASGAVREASNGCSGSLLFFLLRQRGPGACARGGDPALQHAVLPLRPEDAPRPPRQGHQVSPCGPVWRGARLSAPLRRCPTRSRGGLSGLARSRARFKLPFFPGHPKRLLIKHP